MEWHPWLLDADYVDAFRSDADAFPGVMATQRRIVSSGGLLIPAFRSLGLVPPDDLMDFAASTLSRVTATLDDEQFRDVMSVALYLSMVVIEGERERLRREGVSIPEDP